MCGLGAVPRRLMWDNETGIGGRTVTPPEPQRSPGPLATRIVQVKPYATESEGVVEWATCSWRLPSCLAGLLLS